MCAVATGRHFALTRYGDGEGAILQNHEISTICGNRHWCYRPSQGLSEPILSEALNAAFDLSDPDYYVGISCPCCNGSEHRYYMGRLSNCRRLERTTYATLFSNGNWKYLYARFLGAVSETRRSVVLITHWNKDYRRARNFLPYNCVEIAPAGSAAHDRPVPSQDGLDNYVGGSALWYCQNREEIEERYRTLARSFHDAIFLVQLGPIANILIHQMFLANRENTYLDMGHSLDGIIYGEPSVYRAWMMGEDARMCRDMEVSLDL